MRLASMMARLTCTVLLTIGLGACAAATEGTGVGESASEIQSAAPKTGTHLRILAGNLSSGNNQSWDPGHGSRIVKGLAPDVALLQEMNFGSNTDADYKSFMTATFGQEYAYTVEDHVQIPNAVFSRYPIKESGTWDDPRVSNRAFQWARIDIPGDHDLWAVSVHLLTSSAGNRQAEAAALVAKLKASAPASDYIVIGGDFNTSQRSEQALTTFGQITRTTGPWPADPSGGQGTNASRKKPLDWVIVDPDLDALMVPVKIGSGSYTNGLVFDSRTFPGLTDVAPVQKADSGSVNMQHMAIVKDFVLPE